ncbi:hypothetical protein UlMin_042326, partial [Ulmus minor]
KSYSKNFNYGVKKDDPKPKITTASNYSSRMPSSARKNIIFFIYITGGKHGIGTVKYHSNISKIYFHDPNLITKISIDESRVHDYMVSQTEINSKMRAILIDWLIDIHRKFELMAETLYLTVNIVDRYLSVRNISWKLLQLVGMSLMIVACKYEEVYAPHKEILGMLGWYLTVPTPYVFLVRYIKASVKPGLQMENMVFFLAELGILHYQTVILYSPSLIAAAAVYAAHYTLDRRPFWSENLKHHAGYSEEQLRGCAKLLVAFHLAAVDDHLCAVYRKFSKPDRGAVAQFTPAKALLE